MLGENIKALRKEKGYSQETLSQQLNVVRQTISKWEKGLSVPDAEQLERMAELFEVPVSELLDNSAPAAENEKTDMAEVVKQLAVLNEQLAYQARSRRRTMRIVLACIIVLLVLPIIILIISASAYTALPATTMTTRRECVYVLDGKEYNFAIEYDGNGKILELISSPYVVGIHESQKSEDAEEMMEYIDNWFTEKGGLKK